MCVAFVGRVGRRHAEAEFSLAVVVVITVYTSSRGSWLGAVTEQPKQCDGGKEPNRKEEGSC